MAATQGGDKNKRHVVKKRLMGRESDFDRDENVYVGSNETRGQTIEKGKTIFNTIIDSKSDHVLFPTSQRTSSNSKKNGRNPRRTSQPQTNTPQIN